MRWHLWPFEQLPCHFVCATSIWFAWTPLFRAACNWNAASVKAGRKLLILLITDMRNCANQKAMKRDLNSDMTNGFLPTSHSLRHFFRTTFLPTPNYRRFSAAHCWPCDILWILWRVRRWTGSNTLTKKIIIEDARTHVEPHTDSDPGK